MATNEEGGQDSYTAKDLAVLEGLDAVRKRPGMYIGSTDSRGLMHCLWEIIDNAVDESLAGYCKKIDINLESDGSVEVHDDGRGIPVDKEPKTGLTRHGITRATVKPRACSSLLPACAAFMLATLSVLRVW